MTTPPRVLVAGIGNIFFGDDAFGVEVARRLAAAGLPEGARAVDFGIRGLDLAYALLDGSEAVVLVDATARGGRPGTLYLLELSPADFRTAGDGVLVEGHNLDPASVLRLASSLGEPAGRLFLVGCEPVPLPAPESTEDEGDGGRFDDFGAGLSPAVSAAVDEAVRLVASLVAALLNGGDVGACGFGTVHEKEAGSCRD